jgi:hypothetical protein
MMQSKLTNYFYPQQKLVSKVRIGAKVSKKYDTAATPHRRAECHDNLTAEDKAILADTHASINPPPSSDRSKPSPPSCSRSPPARPDRGPKHPSSGHWGRRLSRRSRRAAGNRGAPR